MSKFKKSQVLVLFVLALLLIITPFLPSSFRPTYLYFILNFLIIVLGAEAGLLSAFTRPLEDKKQSASVIQKPAMPQDATLEASSKLSPFHFYSVSLFNLKLDPISLVSKSQHAMEEPPQAGDTPKSTIKFLCSYGGKILPRYPDGKLRYVGGHTRVLAVHRSISFSELSVKLGELCGGSAVSLRCQLPTEDLDALVSITSDEDLANLIEEYDRVAPPPSSLKIRAFLSPPKSLMKLSTPSSSSSSSLSKSSSMSSSSTSSSSRSPTATAGSSSFGSSRHAVMPPVVDRCVHQTSPPIAYPIYMGKPAGRNIPFPHYAYHGQENPGHIYLIHNGNHWQ